MSNVVSLGVLPMWEPSLDFGKIEGFILNNENIEEFLYLKENMIEKLIDETDLSIKEQTQKWVTHWLFMDGIRSVIEEEGSVELQIERICGECETTQNNDLKEVV